MCGQKSQASTIGEFPKIRGTLFWGPYNKDPTIWGTILGPPIFGNSHRGVYREVMWMRTSTPQSES